MASIRRYGTKTGEARYLVRWRDRSGTERSRAFTRHRDAQRFGAETERRRQLGQRYEAKPQTFGQFLTAWLARYEQRVRPSTLRRGREALRHVEGFGRLTFAELTAADVEDQITAVAKTAPRSAQMTLALTKQIVRSAKERGQVVDDGILALRPPRAEAAEMRFLSWHEVEELARWTAVYGNLVLLAALTGMRQGELFALRDLHVDLEARLVRVEASASNGQIAKLKTKASRRTAHLGAEATQVLREQLLAREPTPLGLVFPAPDGGVLRKDNFMARVFRPAVRRAALEPLRFHDLRHTFCSLMVAAGVDPMTIAAELGHADGHLVFKTYGHLYPGAGEARRRGARPPYPGRVRGVRVDWKRRSLTWVARNPCKRRMERTGIEPVTSGLQSRRSPS
jgi:integrase